MKTRSANIYARGEDNKTTRIAFKLVGAHNEDGASEIHVYPYIRFEDAPDKLITHPIYISSIGNTTYNGFCSMFDKFIDYFNSNTRNDFDRNDIVVMKQDNNFRLSMYNYISEERNIFQCLVDVYYCDQIKYQAEYLLSLKHNFNGETGTLYIRSHNVLDCDSIGEERFTKREVELVNIIDIYKWIDQTF